MEKAKVSDTKVYDLTVGQAASVAVVVISSIAIARFLNRVAKATVVAMYNQSELKQKIEESKVKTV
jgi:C4-dicarboxylate transporter